MNIEAARKMKLGWPTTLGHDPCVPTKAILCLTPGLQIYLPTYPNRWMRFWHRLLLGFTYIRVTPE